MFNITGFQTLANVQNNVFGDSPAAGGDGGGEAKGGGGGEPGGPAAPAEANKKADTFGMFLNSIIKTHLQIPTIK